MSTTFSTKIATAVNGIDDIVTAMLWKIGENIDKTLEKIASEMEPQEISSDEEFKEHFLTTTVNHVKTSFSLFMFNRRTELGLSETKKNQTVSAQLKNDEIAKKSLEVEGKTKPSEPPATPVPHKYLDNYKSELSKLKPKKVKSFMKSNPNYDLNIPTINVFGVGQRCHICFKPFKSLADLLAHREEAQHYLMQFKNTPINLRSLTRFELSPYDSSDDESFLGVRKLSPGSARVQPIKCKFCPREFTQKTFLRKHEEKHQAQNDTRINIKPKMQPTLFKCTICPKQFSKKLLFVQHQQTHAKGKSSFIRK